MLARRPASGEWSAIENVRHLLFAEQAHLGRFVPGGLGLSPTGLLQKGLQRHKLKEIVGTNPSTDLAAVFDEWERVHEAACTGIDLSHPGLADRLQRHLRHQQRHGKSAARALRRVAAELADVTPRAAP
jgi:hypothetical protein